MKTYISRPKYDTRIQPYMRTELIKVLIGQRRVGKSYLLRQVRDEMAQQGGYHFIYIDKENDDFAHLVTASDLSAYIRSQAVAQAGVINCIMVDEVQEIIGFEQSIRSFAARPDFDVYITGSNSDILSGELATC